MSSGNGVGQGGTQQSTKSRPRLEFCSNGFFHEGRRVMVYRNGDGSLHVGCTDVDAAAVRRIAEILKGEK